MEIDLLEVHLAELTLCEPLATGAGAQGRRPVVLVRLVTDLGEGWGECAALAEPTYSEEHAPGAVPVLLEHLAPRVLAAPALRAAQGARTAAEASLAAMAPVRGHRMAKAAIEMAVLDAGLRAEGRPLAALLGAEHDRVPAGATVGLQPSAAALVAAAGRTVTAGYCRCKCKVAPGPHAAQVAVLRRELPELALAVDANGSYRLDDPDDAADLRRLDALGLVAIEQPLDPDDLLAHARLAADLETPVLLDEAVRTAGALEAAAALGAADGLVVKPGPVGGLLAAAALARRCASLGWSCALGGMLESGLGRAASLAVGAMAAFDLPGDLGGSERYFARDLTEPHRVVDGVLAVPSSPGVGRRPLEDALEAARTTLLGTVRAPSPPRGAAPASR